MLFGIGSADVNRVIWGQRGWVFSFKVLGLRVKACDSSLARNREAFVCRSERLAVLRLNAGGEGKSADTGFKGLTGHHWREVNSLCQAQRLLWGASLFVAHARTKTFKKTKTNGAPLACKGIHVLL